MNSGRRIVSILEHRRHNRYDLTQENGGFYAYGMLRCVASSPIVRGIMAQEQRAMGIRILRVTGHLRIGS